MMVFAMEGISSPRFFMIASDTTGNRHHQFPDRFKSMENIRSLKGFDEAKRKKLISAMLAFPFPFGFMGAHRVMLGSKPWIPVVYVATFGGCFGLLPMLDFIAILCTKDIEEFENNPKVFMWLK